jgi:hypothetical protein
MPRWLPRHGTEGGRFFDPEPLPTQTTLRDVRNVPLSSIHQHLSKHAGVYHEKSQVLSKQEHC